MFVGSQGALGWVLWELQHPSGEFLHWLFSSLQTHQALSPQTFAHLCSLPRLSSSKTFTSSESPSTVTLGPLARSTHRFPYHPLPVTYPVHLFLSTCSVSFSRMGL